MDFVIHVNGEDAEQGFWVLEVDAIGERFLLAGTDGALRWVNMADCTFVRGANPEVPRPVVLVQPQKGLVAAPPSFGNGRR